MFIEEGELAVEGHCVGLRTVSDYDNTTNSFVAIVSDSSGECSLFWAVNESNSTCNLNGNVTNTTVH